MRRQTKKAPLFEFVGERLLVQENPWVLELAVEPVLGPPNAPDCVVHVAIPGQHDHCCVGFPNVQRLACVEVRWDVVLVGDIFVRSGGELALDVREGGGTAVFLVGDGKNKVETDLSSEMLRSVGERGSGSRRTYDDEDHKSDVPPYRRHGLYGGRGKAVELWSNRRCAVA